MKAGLKSIVVLTLICLLITAALAGINAVTGPIIAKAEEEAAAAACMVVMPQAEGFTQLEKEAWPAGVPENVTAIFEETSGNGYAIRVNGKGYSSGLVVLTGIDKSGAVTGTTVISNTETPTIGGKCFQPAFTDQFLGKTASLDGVNAIAGATYTSNGYKNAVSAAFDAFAALGTAE